MKKIFDYLPELEGDEALHVSGLLDQLSTDKCKLFATVYRSRRRDPILLLIFAVIGLFGVAGIHRFFVGHIGMGILYFLTMGLCFIGTIVDMINYKNFAFEYNRKIADHLMKDLER